MAYLKPSMFKRASKFTADTFKWGASKTMRGMRATPGVIGSVPLGIKSMGLSTHRGIVNASKFAFNNKKKTAFYGIAGGLGAASVIGKSGFGIANKTMRGILPNTQYPAASGRFGVRTSTQAGPAGIDGLKFNYRRK